MILLDGQSMTPERVAQIARGDETVGVTGPALGRAHDAWQLGLALQDTRPIYGRTTGVGANRKQAVGADDRAGHGLRLLRSHASGAGPLVSAELVRAMIAVRANQLAAGGAGLNPAVVEVLVDTLNRGDLPEIHRFGAIGTADLTALAELALTLQGERRWAGGAALRAEYHFESGDALPFLSSNALTLAEASIACDDLGMLTRASLVVASLSFVAARGNIEAYSQLVHGRNPDRGAALVAETLRTLLDGGDAPARIQDPYGFRAIPQTHGPLVDALRRSGSTLAAELNGALENPLISVDGADIVHHAEFLTVAVALDLDAVRNALGYVGTLSLARLTRLHDPDFTGLGAFLAEGAPGSSGTMMLEYAAASALSALRATATPSSLGSGVVLSRGMEEAASGSTQAAWQTTHAVTAFRTVISCELIAAIRALRLSQRMPRDGVLAEACAVADRLNPDAQDRDLGADLAHADTLLPQLAALAKRCV